MKVTINKIIQAVSIMIISTGIAKGGDFAHSPVFYGHWKVTKFVVGSVAAVTTEQAKSYINKTILLGIDSSAIFGDSCFSTKYTFDTVNTDKYLSDGFRGIDRNTLGIKADKISVITIACKSNPKYKNDDSPDFKRYIIKVDDDNIIVPYQGFFFFLRKERSSLNMAPMPGDTVRCCMGKKCSSTGYVIQGSRAKGHLIHVNPVNKNVPAEKVSKQDIKKISDDK